MSSELRSFNNIPRYLLSPDAKLKRCALDMLMRELKRREVRRPWGSIEPFIVVLYHVVFIDKDMEAGESLLSYLDKVLPKVRNTLPIEVQEATDIILHAVRAEIGEIDKDSVLKYIQSYRTTSLISELVKRVVIIELKGEYDEYLDELLRKIDDEIKQKHWYLESLLEEPDSENVRDIIEHFFLDLDIAYAIERPKSMFTIYDYFIHRAEELQKEYRERRKIIDLVKIEYEELKQKYNEIVNSIASKAGKVLPITINILIGVITYLLSMIARLSIVASSGIAGLALIISFIIIKQLRDIIISYVSKISLVIARLIARCTREGRNIVKDIKYKERVLRDLENKLKKFR